jgi:hypothetical protein
MKRLLLALAASALVAVAAPSDAGQLLDLAVVSRTTGERIPVYPHQGRLYVPGRPGEKYALFIANRTGGRVLAAVSVDGVNVVTGETAAPDQGGYVLGPWQSYEIAGWRKNLNEVAAFYFTRLPDSYAARTNRPENVGVIGVAVFSEREPPRPRLAPEPMPAPLSKRGADAAAGEAESRAQGDGARAPSSPAAASAPDDARTSQEAARSRIAERREKIGTGHGERERSNVAYTNFRRATSQPREMLTIYYDTRANLVARGIIPRPAPVVEPDPFPGARFVPDPQG